MHPSKLQNAIVGWKGLTGLSNVIKCWRSNGVNICLTYFLQKRQQMIQTCITIYQPRKIWLFHFILCSMALREHKMILHSKWVPWWYLLTSDWLLFCQDFLPKLQDQLLDRLFGRDFDGDTHGTFTPSDRQSIRIVGDKIYSVGTCCLYYTLYDVQRKSDTVKILPAAWMS